MAALVKVALGPKPCALWTRAIPANVEARAAAEYFIFL